MAEKKCELRLLNDNDEVLCELGVIIYYDENDEFDEGESFYIHPLTGSECLTTDQVNQGWSEQNPVYQDQWDNLIYQVDNDMDLYQKVWDMEVVEYYYKPGVK